VLWRWANRFPNGALVFPSLVLCFVALAAEPVQLAGVFALVGDDTIGSSEPPADVLAPVPPA